MLHILGRPCLSTGVGRDVSATVSIARWRLLLAAVAVIVSVAIYLPAEAHATAFHDFYRHFAHPWGSVAASWCVLGLCVLALALTWPLVRAGSFWQRGLGIGVWIIPLLILSRYLVWLVHQWRTG